MDQKRVYKLVLTGGPCGGKTTGQARLCTFFENMGWKVFRVPETATVLLSGGIKFSDLNAEEVRRSEASYESEARWPEILEVDSGVAFKFQENLLRTMIQIENTFFQLGESCSRSCLIICDRGAMDASAFISKDKWELMMASNGWNNVELRDNRFVHDESTNFRSKLFTNIERITNCEYAHSLALASKYQIVEIKHKIVVYQRYNQIIHMVSAANGAEDFYSTDEHVCRSEGVELARELDYKAAAAWVGHPYFDVIDNSQDFETKICRMIECVCQKLGIDTGDRLRSSSRKVKFLVKAPLPADNEFPAFQDFDVVHNYLQSNNPKMQARLRKRGQKGHWSYIHTIRRPKICGQVIEVKTQLTHRDYLNMLAQRDDSHFTIFKRRRCFLINNQYFQLDIYREPAHPRCHGLMLLETYTALTGNELKNILPQFLTIEKEVTGNPDYSMFNLSLREEWNSTNKYCHNLNAAMQSPENTAFNISISRNLITETQSNGLDRKANVALGSTINGQQTIGNKSVNGTQNVLTNGKAAFAERCNINGDSQESKFYNISSASRLNENL